MISKEKLLIRLNCLMNKVDERTPEEVQLTVEWYE
jgi:hypothetical protein